MLTLIPISVRDATAFVARVHRHHDPPRGAIFCIACGDDAGTIHAVAMVVPSVWKLCGGVRRLWCRSRGFLGLRGQRSRCRRKGCELQGEAVERRAF